MADILKLSENEWVKIFFVQNGWLEEGIIQDGWHHQFEWEWMSFSQIELVWVRVLCKMAESKIGRIEDGCHHQVESEWMSEVYFVQNGWLEESRIQYGWHHQVEWEWMSLSQIELVWVRVLCKMAESKMVVSESNMSEFKMAAIIKRTQDEWVKFFCAKWLNPGWQNSRWLPSSC